MPAWVRGWWRPLAGAIGATCGLLRVVREVTQEPIPEACHTASRQDLVSEPGRPRRTTNTDSISHPMALCLPHGPQARTGQYHSAQDLGMVTGGRKK